MPDGVVSVTTDGVDYVGVFKRRIEMLKRIRRRDVSLDKLKLYYRDHIADFINDWGVTYDPRNVGQPGKIAYLPFLLYPRQREVVEYVIDRWKTRNYGLIEKSRDIGMSWLAVAISASLCIFNEDMAVGFGSRKESYVDKAGDPKSLFWKARMFIENLPREFQAGWDKKRDAPHMRLTFPAMRSVMTGEAGDNIGRGDRTGIYIVDEAAYLERPLLVDAALSQTTNCRIDISSANGMNNPFAQRRHSGKFQIFTFNWRDDPRKDDAWYAKQVHDLDPVVVAQEIDINYMASVEGVLIPNEWVQAAIDAHVKLGIEPRGATFAALDVADEGKDKNAICAATGIVAQHMREWRGKHSDIFATTQRAFDFCDEFGCADLLYDADGLGAGVRGDARVINDRRDTRGIASIRVEGWRASGPVLFPEREDIRGRRNKDYFKNRKVQAWWALKERFRKTHRAVVDGVTDYDPDELISIDSHIEDRDELIKELSQVQWGIGNDGLVTIIKAPQGMPSPNRADAFMMRMSTALEPAEKFFQSSFMMLHEKPVDVTQRPDTVFAVFVTHTSEGRDNDGAAVVLFAHTARPGYPLMVLDWDITEITADLSDVWLPSKMNELNAYARVLKARMGSLGGFTKDQDIGSVLIRRAQQLNHVVHPIEIKVQDEERALNIAAFVREKQVMVTPEAHGKITGYKGVAQNHLLAQIAEFRAGQKDLSSRILLNAFTLGVALSRGDVEGF